MSWIKEEPLNENEYKFNPDLYQDLSQDIHKIHRNDHLDIIDTGRTTGRQQRKREHERFDLSIR